MWRTVYILVPLSREAKEWVEENVSYEMTLGEGIPVEWRFIDDIVEALRREGFERGKDFAVY